MPTQAFALRTLLPTTPETVFEHLSDPHNYLGLSPLIVEVRDVRRDGAEVRYTAVERFRFGFLRHDNVIEVSLVLGAGTIDGAVRSPGGVRLRYGYRIEAAPAGTAVLDHIALSTPRGLLGFAAGQARKAQLGRSRELARRFPEPPPGNSPNR
ncbi:MULTISPECIES: SRPBCC family protein [unclassified Crossiella]|uniref:SRPBCC family protein n=1 Tax=unclassified Crossiella TaxID=2620835 RepID=UPI001FFEE9C4|nr:MULTISPECIES: SRPBCC family protein [unclassified Crossiella]MCK2244682.1 SRPBCC family protein [Crossiella sp. S99.2]MCK2258331.1 SRPBCC family protein [Crossiella sp. S99.1]